jgi:hypothetical protein
MKKSSKQITLRYFHACLNLEGEIPFKDGRFVTP